MNTLRLNIANLEINDKQQEIGFNNFERYYDYNETFKTQVLLLPNSQYKNIVFSEITSPVALVVVADKLINVKVNDFEITNTKMVLLNTNINDLQIANVDLNDATVTVCIWGKE